MDIKEKIIAGIFLKVLMTTFFIGGFFLPMIGGIEVCLARAEEVSHEGRIVFERYRSGALDGIWVMDADGKNEKQLTQANDSSPAWSPDGKRITFSRRIDPNTSHIYTMDADGSNVQQLTDGKDVENIMPTWLPDGKYIGFTREFWVQKGGQWELKSGGIYVMDRDGANVRRLTENFDRYPVWSPDGKKIVFYFYNQIVNQRPNQVWVVDADGGNRKMLYDWGRDPDWSPDGKRIVFNSGRNAWNAWQSNDIYVMDADGSNVEILTKPSPSWEECPKWSPDGRKIVFASDWDNPKVNFEIYVMNADGSNVQRLTNTNGGEWSPDWTADSHAVEPNGKLNITWGEIKRRIKGQ